MRTSLAILTILVLLGVWYLSFCATRLDRLHHRVETSWAVLDGLLQRRAAIALEIAHQSDLDRATEVLITAAAYHARESSIVERSDTESALTGILQLLQDEAKAGSVEIPRHLLQELGEDTKKIAMAINIHREAVDSAVKVRNKWVYRVFRLAGHAPLPVTYAFEDENLV